MVRHFRISGLVQGVGYRASFQAQACALGLCGWVRNRSDGTVEAVVSGPQDAVERITAWAKQGPRAARVGHVAVTEIDERPAQEKEFSVLPTR